MMERGRDLATVLVLTTVFFTGCTIQSRLYRPGLHVVSCVKKRPALPAAPVMNRERVVSRAPLLHETMPKLQVANNDALTEFTHDRKNRHAGVSVMTEQEFLAKQILSKSRSQAIPPEPLAPGGRKADWMGLAACAMSIGGWFAGTFIAVPVFLLAAVLALISLNRIGKAPEQYVLKTLSLVALIVAVAGAALSLFTLILLLFS